MSKDSLKLAKFLFRAESIRSLSAGLEDLLTDKELKQILKRIEIIQHLREGMSHREISSNLSVSIDQVTRGAKWLKNRPDAIQNLIGSKK